MLGGEGSMRFFKQIVCGVIGAVLLAGHVGAQEYRIQAGDFLRASVWKEPDLLVEALVGPDGRFAFPLIGDIQAEGRTVDEIKNTIAEGIQEYIPDPVVTVSLINSLGNKIYVMGKVNRPGEYPMVKNLDVMQALAMGGGLATFADTNGISVLRREGGSQRAIPFDYGKVARGKALEQNIVLQPGDTVVVP